MNEYKRSKRSPAILAGIAVILLLALVTACQKESEEPSGDTYLIDYTLHHLNSPEIIQAFLSAFAMEYPEAGNILENSDYGIKVYIMTYRTHYKDSLITASGLVCLPAADGNFPVISFQNGTNTAHDHCPTKDPYDEGYFLMQAMASNGYIVLIPDYIGFGAAEEILHPYYHRVSTNNAVIDMLHAFDEMKLKSDILAGSTDHTYLMGYSQGGWATLSVLDALENGEEAGINITAASCGAGAYDLMTMSTNILNLDTYPGPHYLPYFIYSKQDMGLLQEPLDKFFKTPYLEKIPQLFDGSLTNDEVNSQLTDQIPDLVTVSLIDDFQDGQEYGRLRELLAENSVYAWDTNIKLHFYHGTADQHVPPEQSSMIYNNFLAAGANPDLVGYTEFSGLDHGSGLFPWGISSITWFNTLENK
jgi:pimeloyl-ACP methyl ester carboxylesterase